MNRYSRIVTAKKIRLLTLLLCVSLLLSGCVQKTRTSDLHVSRTGFFLDTVISIAAYGTADETLLDECFSLLEYYENLFSRTREGSDIWNVNHSSGTPTEISAETANLLQIALKYCKISDGAFDITIAPVLSLWNFLPEQHFGTLPDEDALQEALQHVDYRNVLLDDTTVTLLDPEAGIDLGAIAKGYIADRLKEYLLSAGCKSALISLGGNILTIGSRPDGTPWKIGIRKPFAEANDLITTLRCTDSSIVTSGTYERYFEQDGILYHHILNAKDGYPVQNGLASVTILSEHSVDGDALSTVCFILGPDEGQKLIDSLDSTEAMFVTENLDQYCSDGWPAS